MRETIKLPLTGGCQCGAVRYTITGAPDTLYCCHCTECQAQSSSAFGMSLRVEGPLVELSGTTRSYIRDAGQPNEVECVHCAECGARVVHRRNATSSDYSIKAGTLDKPVPLRPVGHIWPLPESILATTSQCLKAGSAFSERRS